MIVKKKSKLLIPILLVLMIALCSCSNIADETNKFSVPKTTDVFTQEFMDSFVSEYRLYDPQLHYLSIEPFEVRLEDPMISGLSPNFDALLISTINNVAREEFVAVTHYRNIPSLAGDSTSYVYQKNGMQFLMNDYTVKSVSVVRSKTSPRQFIGSTDFKTLKKQTQNYFELFLENENTQTLIEYKAEESANLINSLQGSYTDAIPDDLSAGHVFTCDEGDIQREKAVYYYLLFKFEETDNLVWFVPIYKDNTTGEKLYYAYSYYEVTPKTTNDGIEYFYYEKNNMLAPVSEEVEAILRQLIS